MIAIKEVIEKKQEVSKIEKQIEELKRELNAKNFDHLYKTICRFPVIEDEDFQLNITYCVGHGFNINLTEKSSKYRTYDIFGSYSWFNEWFEKLFKAVDVINLKGYTKLVEDDLSNFEEIKESLIRSLDRKNVKTRLESFFKYIVNDIKYLLREEQDE